MYNTFYDKFFYENYTKKFITIQILFQVIVLICLIVGSTFRDYLVYQDRLDLNK